MSPIPTAATIAPSRALIRSACLRTRTAVAMIAVDVQRKTSAAHHGSATPASCIGRK